MLKLCRLHNKYIKYSNLRHLSKYFIKFKEIIIIHYLRVFTNFKIKNLNASKNHFYFLSVFDFFLHQYKTYEEFLIILFQAHLKQKNKKKQL